MSIGRPTGSKRRGAPDARHTVQIRVSGPEQTAFAARAAELGLSVSEWLRTLARHDAGLWTGSSVTGDNPADE